MQKNGFGERLKNLLKQKGLTQSQVAIAAGTSVPSVNRWTRGGEIEYDNLRTLADYLEVNWVWLRYGNEAITSLQDTMSDNSNVSDTRREYLSQIMDSEARMKSALEMAEIVHWEWNVLTGKLSYSDNALSVFNETPDSFRSTLLPFADLSLEALIELFSKHEPYQWDFVYKPNESKARRWFASRGKLIFDLLHRPVKIIAVSAEITNRKLVEHALERSEYMMRKIIETIPVGLWAADETSKICLANPEVKRIWGGAKYVELDDYGQYKGWWEKTGEEVGADGWTLARAVTHGEISTPEVVNIEAFDGVKRTILMHATPLFDNDNQIIGAIEVNQDITDLKKTEKSLQRSLNQWDAIFDQSLFGIVYFSHDNTILRVNEQLAKYLKKTSETLKGISINKLFDSTSTFNIQNRIDQAKSGQVTAFHISGRLKDEDEENEFNMYFVHDNRQLSETTTVGLVFLDS
jgi:PAS domain S-box-containing protein